MRQGLRIPCLLVAFAGTLAAKESPEAAPSSLDLLAEPPDLLRDTAAILRAPLHWDRTDRWRFALAVGTVTATALALDRPGRDAFLRNDSAALRKTAERLDRFGSSYAIATVAGISLASWATGDDTLRATGTDAIYASLISGLLITPALKFAAGRARPSQDRGPARFQPGGGWESFPSGHTTEAFTVASVIAAHYPSLWVQIPAYGLASLAGLSRMALDAHWASDVAAGAIIGTTVGRFVVNRNGQAPAGRRSPLQVTVSPTLGGLCVTARF